MADYDLNNELKKLLSNLPEFLPEEATENLSPEQQALRKIQGMLTKCRDLMQAAQGIYMQDTDTLKDSMFAKIINDDVAASILMSVMISPEHTDGEKLRMVIAVVCALLEKQATNS